MIGVEEFPVDHHQPCWVTPYLRTQTTQGGGGGSFWLTSQVVWFSFNQVK